MRKIHLYLIVIAAIVPLPAKSADTLADAVSEKVRMPLEYHLDGVVEARHQATLSAEVAGKVEAVFFDVDDEVEKGQVVLKIRDQEYRAQRARAAAALDEAGSALQEARLEFDRNRDLLAKKLISQAQFDRAVAGLEAARARKAAAEAVLAQAEEQLGYTVVRAPYSGVVVERHVEPGESTVAGKPIMTGFAPGQLRVSARVPQSMIGGLRRYRSAGVLVIESGVRIAVDKIVIHPFADPQNHSFPVRLDLPADTAGLYPGMLVKVAITIGETERLLLPRQALVSRAEINAVYVVDEDGTVGFRQVRPGNRYGERVEILAGLDPGERVALDPVRAGIEFKRQRDAHR